MSVSSSQDVVQRGSLSQEGVAAGSGYGSPEPAVTNNGSDSAATVIAVLALLALVVLADDVSGCVGSACATTGTN